MGEQQSPTTALILQVVNAAAASFVATSWLGWVQPLAAFIASIFAIALYGIQIWQRLAPRSSPDRPPEDPEI